MFVAQAHSTLPSYYNAALNRPAYQSSLYYQQREGFFNASLANDGNRETVAAKDGKPFCAISNTSTNPWWAVDLGRPTTVHRVDLTNRGEVIMKCLEFHEVQLLFSSVHSEEPNPMTFFLAFTVCHTFALKFIRIYRDAK